MSEFKKPLEIIPYQFMDVAKPGAGLWVARTNNTFGMPDTFEHLNMKCTLTDEIYAIPDKLVAAGAMEIRFYAADQKDVEDNDINKETITAFVDDHSNCKEAH